MNIKVSCAAALALIATAAYGQTAKPLPIEQFTKFDEFGTIKISPDGESLAFTTMKDGDSVLALVSLKQGKAMGGLASGKDFEVDGFEWVSNTRLIYTLKQHVAELAEPIPTGEIFAVDRDLKNKTMLYGFRAGEQSTGSHIKGKESSYATALLVSALRSDEKKILISEWSWQKAAGGVFERNEVQPVLTLLDVYSGAKRKLGTVPLGAAEVIVDNDDQPRFAIGQNAAGKTAVAWKPMPSDEWKNFNLSGFRDESVTPRGFGENNETVYFTGVAEKDSRAALYRLNLKTQAVEVVFAFPNAEVDSLIYDFSGRRIVGAVGHADGAMFHWLDENDRAAKLYKSLGRAFPKQAVNITSATDDGKKAIVFVSSDTNPGDYYLFDTETMKADYLKSARSWLDPALMRAKEPFAIKARDGLELHGYLTRPAGAGPHPLVVLPHGGPHWQRDYKDFDGEVQLLANRGYAVLQVNFRGSGGFGIDFQEAGYREWGRKMQDDLTDATRWAIEQKVTTADRICIYGASYGGYAAMMGAIREPKLYKCAISHVGVYDIELLFSKSDTRRYKSGRVALEKIHGTDPADLHARSPVYNAEKIEIPLLLIHGKEDERVDFEHAKRMRSALDKANKQYEWMALANEGHGVYDEGTRRQVYERILAFLDKQLAVH